MGPTYILSTRKLVTGGPGERGIRGQPEMHEMMSLKNNITQVFSCKPVCKNFSFLVIGKEGIVSKQRSQFTVRNKGKQRKKVTLPGFIRSNVVILCIMPYHPSFPVHSNSGHCYSQWHLMLSRTYFLEEASFLAGSNCLLDSGCGIH